MLPPMDDGMTYARVTTSNGEQTIALPREIRLDAEELEVELRGDTLTFRPSGRSYGQRLVAAMNDLAELIDLPDDLPVQHREGL